MKRNKDTIVGELILATNEINNTAHEIPLYSFLLITANVIQGIATLKQVKKANLSQVIASLRDAADKLS